MARDVDDVVERPARWGCQSDAVLKESDKALYVAKQSGRNRAVREMSSQTADVPAPTA